jgi:hypothetical protein
MQQEESSTSKSVSFAPTAMLRLAIHINNYSDDEIEACFYSDSEYFEFKRDVKRTARMVEKKQNIGEVNDSRRGVECLTREALKIKSKNRRHARRAVMSEQLNQLLSEEHDGVDFQDDNRIAAAYADTTRESAVMAYLAGLSDEAIVNDYQEPKSDSFERESKAACTTRVLSMVSTKRSLRIQHRWVSNHAA